MSTQVKSPPETGPQSARARAVLVACAEFIRREEYPPSLRDLSSATGLSTSIVAHYLARLQEDRFLRQQPAISRSIVLSERGWAACGGRPSR